ncbi:hypothetical protein ACI65C_007604, partial [Semiaphis heraclei]
TREELWNALEEFGVPAKLIQLVKECNSNICCKVKFGEKYKKVLKEWNYLETKRYLLMRMTLW